MLFFVQFLYISTEVYGYFISKNHKIIFVYTKRFDSCCITARYSPSALPVYTVSPKYVFHNFNIFDNNLSTFQLNRPLFFQLCQCTLCLNYRYINCARQFFLSQNYLHNFLTSSTVFCAIDAICSSETPAFHMERIISLLPSSLPIRSPSSLPIRVA